MSEIPNLMEDQAALYVLGGLTPAQRIEFKGRLAESAELRALVCELEEGAVALALAAPGRKPPSKVWKKIQKAVGEETKRPLVFHPFQVGWWRNGWAGTAACLLGWMLYAHWPNHPSQNVPPTFVSSEPPSPSAQMANSTPIKTQDNRSATASANSEAEISLRARNREIIR